MWQNKQASIRMSNHEDPLEFKNKDEAHVRDKTIPKGLKDSLIWKKESNYKISTW